MKKIILLLAIIWCNQLLAQNANSVWIFGDSAGIDFSNINNPIPIVSAMDGRGSSVSISDTIGNLTFYAFTRAGVSGNTCRVIGKNQLLMQNGDSVVGEAWYNELVIAPMPDSIHKYYLFSIGVSGTSQFGLYYSIIDMTQNSGNGKVILKNVQLLNFRMTDCVQLVKHGNGRDWWLISKQSGPGNTLLNRFYVYLISPSGISAPLVQSFGNSTDGDFQKIIFNNKANKLMLMNFAGFMCQYDFDRCTGIISNPNIIYPEQTSNYSRNFWEGAYSPNDSIFYATSNWYNFTISDTSRLLQYDLFAPNIPASCDTLYFSKNPNVYGAIRLAPDNKIYMTSFYNWGFPAYPYPDSVYNQYNMNLSVINYPDNIGSACDFQPFSFNLGGNRTYGGLPNNPNYELGRLIGSPCDTIWAGINEQQIKNNSELFVFYHTSWQVAFINAKALKGKKYEMRIFDILGKLVYQENGRLTSEYFTKDLNCTAFSKGMYIVNFTTEKEKLIKKFVKQ